MPLGIGLLDGPKAGCLFYERGTPVWRGRRPAHQRDGFLISGVSFAGLLAASVDEPFLPRGKRLLLIVTS